VCARAVSIDRSINLPACSTNLINTNSESLIMQAQAGMVEQPPQIRSVRHLGLRVNYTAMVHMLPRQIEQILKSFPRLKSLKILVIPMNSQSYPNPINCCIILNLLLINCFALICLNSDFSG
jgi:hypothetical protein